jgi:putative endonuclease
MAWSWLRKLAANPTARMALGERGEKFAARHLRRHGYKILARRFKGRGGEIDLVCRHHDWLVFVEVKTRRDEQYGLPSESVKAGKQRHASKTALEYLRLIGNPQVRWRFDIVEVILQDGWRKPSDVRIIQNAFDLSEPYVY